MARDRSAPVELPRKEKEALQTIFNGNRGPAETNATLVELRRLASLQRKGVIEYDDIPNFRTRFGVAGWRVELTERGQKLYPP